MEKIMTLKVQLAPSVAVGRVPCGQLAIIPIIGGSFEGEGLKGRVCTGGADWNTTVSEKSNHVHARYWLQTEDGCILAVENEGWLDNTQPAAVLRTTPRFMCDLDGPYAYLTCGCYAGELRALAQDWVEIVLWRLG